MTSEHWTTQHTAHTAHVAAMAALRGGGELRAASPHSSTHLMAPPHCPRIRPQTSSSSLPCPLTTVRPLTHPPTPQNVISSTLTLSARSRHLFLPLLSCTLHLHHCTTLLPISHNTIPFPIPSVRSSPSICCLCFGLLPLLALTQYATSSLCSPSYSSECHLFANLGSLQSTVLVPFLHMVK